MANNFYDSKYEDTIQCAFFSTKPTQIENLCEALNKTVLSLSKDYIWHRDELNISVSVFDSEKTGMPVHLTSTTCFGDNIEDEWFIVYLVLQITSQYTDLVVQLEDNDGDFLLIEAADFLPQWANPDTTKNRVFIYQNNVHIIPPDILELNSKFELQDAINLVVQKSDVTKAIAEIQEAILKRISAYPKKIKQSLHRASVTLPLEIAALLTLKPALISPIVTSFCNHDILDAKCFKNIKFENCVTSPILFTKYLYAMLMHSKPPRIRKFANTLQITKDMDLGIKLACGYEIIMNKLSNDLYTSSDYYHFINRLSKTGYFRDNIEGSKQYNELLQKAKDYFANIECPISQHYCHNISEIMATEEFKHTRDLLTNRDNTNEAEVDTDEWLNVNPDELSTFLNTHYGKKVVNNNASNTTQITTELAHFLKKTSDFEGIEYEKEEESDANQIDFDADEFMHNIEKMLNVVTCNDKEIEDSESDFSEDDDNIVIDHNIEQELASKLQHSDMDGSKDENILKNLLQSIKEEGVSGPSSNVLKNIDLNKLDLLDSDDD